MRVAYICADPGVPVFGCKGCSIHVREVVAELLRRGADVDLFAAQCEGDCPKELAAATVHPLENCREKDPEAKEQFAMAANARLREQLESAGPFDLVYERYSLWSFAGIEYARDSSVPGLLEVNAPLVSEQAEYRCLVDRSGAERVAARVFASAEALVAVSQEVANYLNDHPAAQGRVHVVANGVDADRFRPGRTPSRARSQGTFTVGFVGSLRPWHGLPLLVEVFAELVRQDPGFRLLVVGDGPERAALEANVASCLDGNAAAVELTGRVDPQQVPGLLASMDAAVAPYPDTDFYFSPLKVLEYMAAGLPVVASRVGEIARWIDHGKTGLLCQPGDATAFFQALRQLRSDPALGEQLGRAARERVVEAHTWRAVVDRIVDVAGLTVPAE